MVERTRYRVSTILRLSLYFLAVGLLAISNGSVGVPPAQIAADNARWIALGVRIPPNGVVLQHPYDRPFSAHSFIVPWAWYAHFYQVMHVNHDFHVRASDLRADLPTLRFLMEHVYAGHATATARRWNWKVWFRAWDRDLAAHGTARLSLHNAFARWGDFERFQLDNHSGVPSLKDYVSGSVSTVLTSEPRTPCTSVHSRDGHVYLLSTGDAGQQPHPVQAWNGSELAPAWYMSYPKRDGVADFVTCGNRRIQVQPTATAPTETDRENILYLASKPSYELLASDTAYIRMPTFTDANDAALEAVLSKVHGLGKERIVMFDLRGNEGGNAPIGILRHWFSDSAINTAESHFIRYSSDSCFGTALYFNLEEQLTAGLSFPAPQAVRHILQNMVDYINTPTAENCTVKPTIVRGHSGLRNHHFNLHPSGDQTRIIALVDNGCGSDCEYMAEVLAGLPDTVIAGTSTYGVMGFTQPGYFVLPHSRVPFRLALSRTDDYGDGRSVDGYGIAVDVLLPTLQSQARSSLLALARRL